LVAKFEFSERGQYETAVSGNASLGDVPLDLE
jgi:hypothetical protein